MKVVILYRPNSEHARMTEDYVRDFRSRYPDSQLDVLSLDTVEGSSRAELYDVVDYPAIIAIQPDGTPHKIWQGVVLPLMDEVASFARI